MAEGENSEEADGDAQATGSEAIEGAPDVAAAPIADVIESQFGAMAEGANPEEAEGGTGTEHGGAHDVAGTPIEVVESQKKQGQTEKGKAVAAQVDSEVIPFKIGDLVTCSDNRGENRRTAEILNWRESEPGMIKYYVHYIGRDKRLDKWVPWTRVQKFTGELNKETLSSLKSLTVDPITPSKVGLGTSNTAGTPTRPLTRKLRRQLFGINVIPKSTEELTALHQQLEKEHEEKTKVKNIQVVWLGKYEIDAWYYSPYPEEYHQDRLYICEFCLKYMRKKKTIDEHKVKCAPNNPPGDEIYQTAAPIHGQVKKTEGTDLESAAPMSETRSISSENVQHHSVYEVDGSKNKLYCQNLCLLAGLFLDHKTLHYEVDFFVFYVLTENDAFGKHLVAYFSKEKDSADKCNIACILTLPPFQRKGYGQFLIAFAYELSKREGMIGTPERPLSDLGQKGFTSYWTRVLLETIRDHLRASIEDLTKWTSIRSEDVISTLKPLGLVMYWKHEYIAHFNKRTVEKHLENLKSQPLWLKFDTDKLNWPFVPSNVPRTPKKPRAIRRL